MNSANVGRGKQWKCQQIAVNQLRIFIMVVSIRQIDFLQAFHYSLGVIETSSQKRLPETSRMAVVTES